MTRSKFTNFVMILTLIATCLVFTQIEGCGRRETMIETLSFSSDDSRICVTKLNAQDAQTPMKHYKQNVSRTISWLNAADAKSGGILHQDFKPGNCGPAFGLWWVGRTSVVCNPANGQLAAADFGGGDFTIDVGAERPVVVTLKQPVSNLAFSKSGRFLAASGISEITVWDNKINAAAMRVDQDNFGFLNAALMAFTDDDTRIVAAGFQGVHVWDIATAMKVSTIIHGSKPSVSAIVVAPDDTLVVCSSQGVQRYDFAGNVVKSFSGRIGCLCAISATGQHLAVGGHDEITVFDLLSNEAVRTIPYEGATALALSSHGDELAVGNSEGRVTLIDTLTGHRRWDNSPAARYR